MILAGDLDTDHPLVWAKEKFPNKEILFVPGNHDFYKHNYFPHMDFLKVQAHSFGIKSLLRPGDHFIMNDTLFIGGILWTDYKVFNQPDSAMKSCFHGMADHHYILNSAARVPITFSPKDARMEFDRFMEGMTKLLKAYPSMKTVVVTHHGCSLKSSAQRFITDPLTPGFVSNLEGFIRHYKQIELWVHGHVHNCNDYQIGQCRVVTNPRGYTTAHATENQAFDPNLIVEV